MVDAVFRVTLCDLDGRARTREVLADPMTFGEQTKNITNFTYTHDVTSHILREK